MASSRITAYGLILLGMGLGLTALLGPLASGTIRYRISDNMENQTLGGDAVLLLIAMPAAFLAAYLWLNESRLAPLLALAPAAFAAYTFLGFILIPDYARYDGNNEKFFPLFAAILALGLTISLLSWSALGRMEMPQPSRLLRRVTAGVLILVAALFALAWGSQIAAVAGGEYSTEYAEHPTAFWLIRTLDFAIIIPATLASGIGLLRGNATALRAAYGLAGFLTLMLASILSMMVVLIARDDPAAEPVALAVLLPVTAGLAALTWKLWSPREQPDSNAAGTGEPTRLQPTTTRN